MKKHFYFSLIFGLGLIINVFPQSMTISGGYNGGVVIGSQGYVYQWGNGLGIRLPKEFIDKTGITDTSKIEVSITVSVK